MMKVLYPFLLLSLAACTMPAAQPFAALDNMPADATSAPTTNAAQLVNQNPHPTTTERPARCMVTAREWLNLRSGPGTLSPGVGLLRHGAMVTMTGNQRGAWVEVMTSAGAQGWVNSEYCK